MSRILKLPLAWSRPEPRPGFVGNKGLSQNQRAGLAYQRAVCAAMGGHAGAWFAFEDKEGRGICQPDLYFSLGPDAPLVLVEVKLTFTLEGIDQLLKLYAPVLALTFGRPILPVLVAKNLTPTARTYPVVGSMVEALRIARPGLPTIIHWLGTTPGPLAPPVGGFTIPARMPR